MLTRRTVLAASLAAPLGPDEVRAAIHGARARAHALLKDMGLSRGTVAERLRRLAADPQWLYPDDDHARDRAVAEMNQRLDRLRPRLAQAFGDLPIPAARVRRMAWADEQAKRGGYRDVEAHAYFVDLSAIRSRPQWTLPSVAFHEVIPGHLLQAASGGSPGGTYAESWAIYAEQLAADLGAYEQDSLGELGFLQWRLFRLARVVVDRGLQSGWSDAQGLGALADIQGFPIAFATFEADVARMRRTPGEYAAQGLGALAIARARPNDRALWPVFHAAALKPSAGVRPR